MGLTQGRFGADLYENYMAVSTNCGSSKGMPRVDTSTWALIPFFGSSKVADA